MNIVKWVPKEWYESSLIKIQLQCYCKSFFMRTQDGDLSLRLHLSRTDVFHACLNHEILWCQDLHFMDYFQSPTLSTYSKTYQFPHLKNMSHWLLTPFLYLFWKSGLMSWVQPLHEFSVFQCTSFQIFPSAFANAIVLPLLKKPNLDPHNLSTY